MTYPTGEPVLPGDHILWHGEAAQIEFVATSADDPKIAWYVTELGPGIMIKTTTAGQVYQNDTDDLDFVRRS